MTATSMSTATATEQPEPAPPDAQKIKIRFCLFFDGTLNNRTNINQRLLARSGDDAVNRDQNILTAEERKAAAELESRASSPKDLAKQVEEAKKNYKKHGAKSDDEENSYEGFYTNVEKMERHLDAAQGKTPGYQYTFKTYVEGVGSIDKGGDQLPGYAFGASFLVWRAGIPDKVAQGLRKVVEQIAKQEGMDERSVIDELALDVFGFSRGAACARNFIYEALSEDENKATASVRRRLRHEMRTANTIKVRFAGLFDTVSTYGVGTVVGCADNVEELKLDAVSYADKVLHLTSADEHRYHFALTDIRSAIGAGTGREYCLPGVHSDIGGGYRDNAFQNLTLRGSDKLAGVILHGNYPTMDEANADRDYFIAEGWCTADEITVTPKLDMEGKILYAEVKVNRLGQSPKQKSSVPGGIPKGMGVRSSYSKIPLNIMAKEMRNQGIIFIPEFEKDERVPDELSQVKAELESYATGNSKTDANYWRLRKDSAPKSVEHNYAADYSEDNNFFGDPNDPGSGDKEWLRKLRHDYLHISARMQPGHDPRFEINEKTGRLERTRKPYHG